MALRRMLTMPSRAKSMIKDALPRPIRSLVTRWRTSRIQRRYSALSLADTFDRIYDRSEWGENDILLNSGPGSTGRYVDEYCQMLRPLLRTYRVKSIADLGCGNFNTGKIIASLVESYAGVDIARSVVERNRQDHAGPRIHFVRADLTRDPLPPADAALVRQVFQHLTNVEILAALDNILATYPLAFITEHVYAGRSDRANLDIPHGPGTRVPMKSGVFIDRPPFSVPAAHSADIRYAPDEVLRTWVVESGAEQCA
jgi:SAM-dependent methyltransferase